MRVAGYEYKEPCFRLDSIRSYFELNMEIVSPRVRHEIFREDRPVYTKVRDELSARYMEHAKISHSIVADGCIIDGTVEHSVLFRGVRIGKGAVVKNSILMQDSVVEEGVKLENCILDKQAVIKKGGTLVGPRGYPIVISKNMMI